MKESTAKRLSRTDQLLDRLRKGDGVMTRREQVELAARLTLCSMAAEKHGGLNLTFSDFARKQSV